MRGLRFLIGIFFLVAPAIARIQYGHRPIYYEDKPQNGILETFSLSFVGNFDFSRTYQGLTKIMDGLSEFIDLKLIHTGVNLAFDTMGANENENSVYSRIGETSPGDVALRKSVTTFIGAMMNKQECWTKTLCILGDYSRSLSITDFFVVMAEKLAPRDWKESLDVFISASNEKLDCREYLCSPEVKE